jgi:hypothetical protein
MGIGSKVFILGSGFSASMGLPTLINLFQEIMSLREMESEKENVFDALEVLYPNFNKKGEPSSYPPFEEFLSLVSSAKDLPFFPKLKWDKNWRSALRLLTDCLDSKQIAAENSALLNEFVTNIQNGDVIITFNWDNLIERALFLQDRSVNFLGIDSKSVTVLKLHGSINWFEPRKGLRLLNPSSVLHLTNRIVCMPDFTYYNAWDVLGQPPLIVPPILSKMVSVSNIFNKIWQIAFNSIIKAERVAVIGYSIPNDDLHARCLLRTSWTVRNRKKEAESELPDKYILVDPNPQVSDKYSQFVSSAHDYYQAFFTRDLFSIMFQNEGK